MQGKIGPPGNDGSNGSNGTNGTNGAQGVQGKVGPQGSPGLSGRQVVTSTASCANFINNVCTVAVTCLGTRKVLGGGTTSTGWSVFPPTVNQTWPALSNQWRATVTNNEPFVSINVTVWAVCAFTT